jgi:hypothetical protein
MVERSSTGQEKGQNMRNIGAKILGLVVLIAMLSPASLLATPMLAIKVTVDNTTTVTVYDGGAGDANPIPGAVTLASAGITATGEGAPFLLPVGSMDLNAVGHAGVPVVIMLSEIGINKGYPAFDISIGGTVTNMKISYDAYYSTTGSFFALDNGFAGLGPFQSASGTAAFSGDLFSQAASGTITSLTQVIEVDPIGDLSPGTRHAYGFDATLNPTPEPSTLVLLGSALLGGGIIRKRWQRG